MTPSITIKKSPIPILWIDTSIVFKITLLRLGKKLDEPQKQWIESLYKGIKKATREGRLICPLADQDEEIWIERKECLKTIHELSLGIDTDSTLAVHDRLFNLFAEAYITQQKDIDLEYSTLFHDDPVQEMKQILSEPMYVTIDPPLIGGAEKTKSTKRKLLKRLNQIREDNVTNNVSFEAQKDAEFMAEFDNIKTVITDPQALARLGLNEQDYFWNLTNAVEKLKAWGEIASKHDKKDASILDFYRSNYYRQIPNKKICVEFFSKLMTDKQPIRSGDVKDVEHISSMLPFVDMLITDKQRKVQLHKLKFNEEYQTTICYIGDSQEIKNFFDSL
jgi:hypothetical protein